MSLTSGTAALRLFHLIRPLPDTLPEMLNANRLPAFDSIKDAPVYGWLPGQDIIPGREINSDTIRHHSHTMATLVRAERKVPTNLLRAECRAQERIRLEAEGRQFLSRHDRQEIRESVLARLLPTTTPSLHGTTMMHPQNSKFLFTDAVSTAAADSLVIHFRHAVDFAPEPIEPASAGRIFARCITRDWMPLAYGAIPAEGCDNHPGYDFMTWLWYKSETAGNIDTGARRAALLVEGPLKLVNTTTSGAQATSLRKGQPVTSSEAKAALLAGKKLASATFSFAIGEEVFRVTINGEDFTFRGLRLPDAKDDGLDPASASVHRAIKLYEFADLFTGLYASYCAQRSVASVSSVLQSDMQAWVKDRQAIS
jgi:hypothetical protein